MFLPDTNMQSNKEPSSELQSILRLPLHSWHDSTTLLSRTLTQKRKLFARRLGRSRFVLRAHYIDYKRSDKFTESYTLHAGFSARAVDSRKKLGPLLLYSVSGWLRQRGVES